MMKRGSFRKSQSKRLRRDRHLDPGRSSYSRPHLISGLFVLVPFPTITGDGSPVKTASRNARRKRGKSLLHGDERRLSGVEQVIGGPPGGSAPTAVALQSPAGGGAVAVEVEMQEMARNTS